MTLPTGYAKAHQVVDVLIKALFDPDRRRLTAQVDRLIARNEECLGQQGLHCFIYNGVPYRQSNVTGHIKRYPGLDYSLWDDMELLLKDQKTVERDQSFIRQALIMLIEPCCSLQEVRDALPECVVDIMPELRALERRYELMWSIRGNVRAQRQVARVIPKLEAYAVARMMF